MALHNATPPRRILLKLSGEAFSEGDSSLSQSACEKIAKAMALLRQNGQELAVVIGGGNICRGAFFSSTGLRRPAADQMGMLATMINGIALSEALEALKCPVTLFSSIECPSISTLFHWNLAQKKLSAGEILVLAGGTGNPFFTTDTAAALRASEIGADLLLKATKVDGIYDKDPLQNKNAIFYPTIRYSDMLAQKLMVMDATAIALCMSRRLAIRVFNMKLLFEPTFPKLLAEGNLGSLVIEN